MRTLHGSLLAGAALALTLPALGVAQDAAVEEPGATDRTAVEAPVDVIQTEDATVTLTEDSAVTDEATLEDAATPAQDATGMDVTEVTPTSAEAPADLSTWTYDDLYASGISIDQMVGADVYGPDGEDIGDVENVLFDTDGRVLSVVAEIGGFLELGDIHVNIPWDMVSTENWSDGIVLPFGEDEVDTYTLTGEETGGTIEASEQVAEVGGDGPGVVETGPNVWRATDLLNGTARLRDGDAFVNYGTVNDIVVQDGRIAAVLVSADASWGGPAGLYGYPYAGMAGWTPGTAEGAAGSYDLPYDRTQAETVQPFDPAMLTD